MVSQRLSRNVLIVDSTKGQQGPREPPSTVVNGKGTHALNFGYTYQWSWESDQSRNWIKKKIAALSGPPDTKLNAQSESSSNTLRSVTINQTEEEFARENPQGGVSPLGAFPV